MSSPFPGMDPYLEAPHIWRGFHHCLADEIIAQLNTALSPRYYADVDVYAIPAAPIQRLAMLPEEYKTRTVEVRTTANDTLVTAIELLSPVNKRGEGLDLYQSKRKSLLRAEVHFIEIDLLRAGERPGWEVKEPPLVCEYIVLVNRAFRGDLRRSEIWPVALNEPLPRCPVPLLPPDPEVPLDLGEVLIQVYRRAAYARRIDYTTPVPPPPLRPVIQQWVVEHIQQGLTPHERA